MLSAGQLPPVTLVLGGARSGKSRYAERLVTAQPGPRIYLATATAGDAEMAERIRHHREQRGSGWTTVEEPLALAERLREVACPDGAVLVDCLTLWLSNLMGGNHDVDAAGAALVDVLPKLAGPVVFVSNEVGLGIVPENALARRFRDAAGRLNQTIAGNAQAVVFIAAGLPLFLKQPDCAS